MGHHKLTANSLTLAPIRKVDTSLDDSPPKPVEKRFGEQAAQIKLSAKGD